MTQTYYFFADQAPGWNTCLKLRTLGWGCLFFGALGGTLKEFRRQGKILRESSFLAGGLATWVSMGLLVRKQEVLYALNFYPFLIPWISLSLSDRKGWQKLPQKLLRGAGIFVLAACPVLFARVVLGYLPLYTPPVEIFKQIHACVPDSHLKIAGPNLLWYDKDLDHFRDIGALMYSHWYTGGQRDAGTWLKSWKPDILVTDSTFNRLFLGPDPSTRALAHLLKARVIPLGSVETGVGSYGTWNVYRLDWSKS